MEEGDEVFSTQRTTGSDTVEDTEERTILTLPIVTTLSFVHRVKDNSRRVRVSPQETPIHLSKERTKMSASLQELRK